MRRSALRCIAALLLGASCGTLADAGNEPKGEVHLPSAGVAPWDKVDLDGDPTNLTQPFVLEATSASERVAEPWAVLEGGAVVLFYERSGGAREDGIWRTRGDDLDGLLHAGPGGRVLGATRAWEAGQVGAPSVLLDDRAVPDERYRMWYAGGDAAGIGYAFSVDGVAWRTRPAPVLSPSETWEAGRVGSPTVLRDGDELLLWYEGGDGAGIGFARSRDGIAWTKEDETGPDTANGPRDLRPVLAPAEPWEGIAAESFDSGHVGRPGVILDADERPPLFRLYYTGYLPIARSVVPEEPLPGITPGTLNRSIGFAASLDGVRWTRAAATINPIVAEKTPLDLGDLAFPPELAAAIPPPVLSFLKALLGVDPAGNPRIPALETVIDEGEALVVPTGVDRFAMLFAQANSIFVPLAADLPPSPVSTTRGLLVQNTRAGLALARSRP